MVNFEGSFVALVTPYKNGEVDFENVAKLVEWHINEGTSGIVPAGTTGECPTLTMEEHEKLIEVVVKTSAGRVPVIAGTGANSTHECVRLTKHAKECGADAALVVNPYYNKPTQEGLYQHFQKVAEIGIPIVLYNIPGRCGVNMTPATVARLAELPSIVAIKEATGSMDAASEIRLLAPRLAVLSGDDSLTLPLMSIGASGVVSVIANICPKKTRALVDACKSGDMEKARALHGELFKLCRSMFCETNPIPVKYAMSVLGLCENEFRLPMTPIADENKPTVEAALKAAGL